MKRVLSSFAAAAMLILAGAQAADSATVTFTDITLGNGAESSTIWVEDGVTVKSLGGGAIGHHLRPGTALLADSGTVYASTAEFTTGGIFSADSFDVVSASNKYCAGAWNAGSGGCGDPYVNVEIKGFLGSVLVAAAGFFKGDSSPLTYMFGAEFSAIDRLLISSVRPNTQAIGGSCFEAPCSQFSIDNVNVSPVPLPAAAGLLLAGLGGLLLRSRFSGRKA